MKLLVLSDLHLEFGRLSTVKDGRGIEEGADVVVLAGDIAEGERGIRWARETFISKEIIYVAGNHEFYGHGFEALTHFDEVHLNSMRAVAKGLRHSTDHNVANVGGEGEQVCSSRWRHVRLISGATWDRVHHSPVDAHQI